MKYLFFFFLAFLLCLSEVSSQNTNMFDFEMLCYDSSSPACGRNVMDVYEQAGQIISDNLILTRRVSVVITVENSGETPYYASTYSSQQPYNDPVNGVVIYYPSALLKQLDPGFQNDDLDMSVEFNSYYDQNVLFFREDPIYEDQVDFLELILHELQHGLGIVTYWYSELIHDLDIFPDYSYILEANDAITFENFKEDLFDTHLVSLDNGDQITNYVQDLNNMAGPSGTFYNSYDDFYNELRNSQQQKGKTYTTDMLNMVTNPKRLGFLPNNADAIELDTSFNPLIDGKSIIHFSGELYWNSPDFLLIPEMEPGKKLEEKIQAYGNAPGGGIGPKLRSMLATMGYQLRIPSTSSNTSSSNKPKRSVNARSRPKRILYDTPY